MFPPVRLVDDLSQIFGTHFDPKQLNFGVRSRFEFAVDVECKYNIDFFKTVLNLNQH